MSRDRFCQLSLIVITFAIHSITVIFADADIISINNIITLIIITIFICVILIFFVFSGCAILNVIIIIVDDGVIIITSSKINRTYLYASM